MGCLHSMISWTMFIDRWQRQVFYLLNSNAKNLWRPTNLYRPLVSKSLYLQWRDWSFAAMENLPLIVAIFGIFIENNSITCSVRMTEILFWFEFLFAKYVSKRHINFMALKPETRPVATLFTLQIWYSGSQAPLPLLESDCKMRHLFECNTGVVIMS